MKKIQELRIAFCDDEKAYLNELNKIVSSYNVETDYEIHMDYYQNAADLLFGISNKSYNIFFLDIELPDDNGMHVAAELRRLLGNKIIIVFMTSYPEFVYQSFTVRAFDYVVKPLNYDRISSLFNRIFEEFQKETATISVETSTETFLIPIDEIMYIRSMIDASLEVHTTAKSTAPTLKCREKLNVYENILKDYYFISPHRGYLVNMQYIHSLTKSNIILKNQQTIPLSRRQSVEINRLFVKYIISIKL